MVDRAIKELVDYVENLDEPTILAVYADHLPALDAVVNQFTGENKYETGYFICSNMDIEKHDEDIAAYQLSTKVLDLVGLDGGIMNKFHRVYKGREDYKENLELLQYDLLFGARYVEGGEDHLKRNKLAMGIEPITIDDVKIKDDKIYVTGKGFNEYSIITVNGKDINSNCINYNEIDGTLDGGEVKEVAVRQFSRYYKTIGTTETYIMPKK